MIRAVLNILMGWREINVLHENTVDALNLLKKHSFVHWRMRTNEDGTISFRMTLREARRFCSLFPEAQSGSTRGLPALLDRYRGRWGIPVGVLVFAVLVWQSCTVVWEVDVSGNERMSKREIITMLEEFGFGVGSRFGGIDFDKMQNDFLLTTDEIAWIAVNMEGTVAHVQVRENLGGKSSGNDTANAANVIAAEDGQIVEVRVAGGRAAVQRGDIVRTGDLLISGVLTVREDGLRFEYGKGEVLAQVRREIVVQSPLTREEIVPTGRETVRKTLKFFAKDVKLFRNSRIEYVTYDTIIMEKQLSLPGGITLPLWITTQTLRETETVTVQVTKEEAFADAAIRLREEMNVLLDDAEILSIETERVLDNGLCKIIAHAVCLADIARTSEIEIH